MTRNLKTLGLSLAAVLALSAISASAASATTGPVASFTASEYTATLKGEQAGVISFSFAVGGLMSCTTANLKGSLTAASTAATVTPEFKNCVVKVGEVAFPATVTMHNCDYKFTVHAGSKEEWTGDVKVECQKAGEGIEVHIYETIPQHLSDTASRCKFIIEPQTIETGIEYQLMNEEPPSTVTINTKEAPVIVRKLSGSLVICGLAAQTGHLNGLADIKAFDSEGGQLGASIVAGMP